MNAIVIKDTRCTTRYYILCNCCLYISLGWLLADILRIAGFACLWPGGWTLRHLRSYQPAVGTGSGGEHCTDAGGAPNQFSAEGVYNPLHLYAASWLCHPSCLSSPAAPYRSSRTTSYHPHQDAEARKHIGPTCIDNADRRPSRARIRTHGNDPGLAPHGSEATSPD